MSSDEIGRLGLRIYDERLKPLLEPQMNGQQVAICIEDGDYEVAPTTAEADARLRVRHPDAVFLFAEVGHPIMDWPWPSRDAVDRKP